MINTSVSFLFTRPLLWANSKPLKCTCSWESERSSIEVPGFTTEDKMSYEVELSLDEHILSRHEYVSINERKRKGTYGQNGKLIVKSVFDDMWKRTHIKKHIIETLQDPSYVVEKEEYVSDDFKTHTKYIFERR